MKVVILAVRVIAILIFVSIIGSSLRTVRASVAEVRRVLVDSDAILSPQARQEIVDYISLMQNDAGIYNPAELVKQLPQRFRYIKSVAIQSLAYNTAHVSIEAFEPLAHLNAHHIITENGALLAADDYDNNARAFVPTITAQQIPAALPAQIVATITRCIHDGITQTYDVTLVNEHELRLSDKQDPRFSIICDASNMPVENILAQCEQLKNKLLAESLLSPSKNIKSWKADIRFHDQIIVSRELSGSAKGKKLVADRKIELCQKQGEQIITGGDYETYV